MLEALRYAASGRRNVRSILLPPNENRGGYEFVAALGRLPRAAGFDCVHWSQVGAKDATDTELMRWAVEHGSVVLTSDLDFGAILAATSQTRPSVLQLRNDLLTPKIMGWTVLSAIEQTRGALEAGALVSIDAARARLRLLPLDHDDEP